MENNRDPRDMPLAEMLGEPNLVIFQLFKIKNILPTIRRNLNLFINFCRHNEEFAYNLIDLAIKVPIHESNNQEIKNVYFVAVDILTCDHDCMADLLIFPDHLEECDDSSEDNDEIYEDITCEIDTQEDHPSNNNKGQFQPQRYKYLLRVMEYMKEASIQENCLNYMVKALNCVVRKKSRHFIDLLVKNENEWGNILLKLTNHTCISEMVVKLLERHDEDQQKDEAETYRHFRLNLITQMNNLLKSTIAQPDFSVRLEFLDWFFYHHRYLSCETRSKTQQNFSILAQKSTIQFYLDHLLVSNLLQNSNSVLYLVAMLRKMVSEQEVDPYNYQDTKKNEYTLNFQLEELFIQFFSTLETVLQNLQSYRTNLSLQQKQLRFFRSQFFELTNLMTKSSLFMMIFSSQKNQCNRKNAILQLLNDLCSDASNGITKVYMTNLVTKLITTKISWSQPQPHGTHDTHQLEIPTKSDNDLTPSITLTRECKSSQQLSKHQSHLGTLSLTDLEQIASHLKETLQSSKLDQRIQKHSANPFNKNYNKDQHIAFFNKLIILLDNQFVAVAKKDKNDMVNEEESNCMVPKVHSHLPEINLQKIHEAYSQALGSNSNCLNGKINSVPQFEFIATSLRYKSGGIKQETKSQRKGSSFVLNSEDDDEENKPVSDPQQNKGKFKLDLNHLNKKIMANRQRKLEEIEKNQENNEEKNEQQNENGNQDENRSNHMAELVRKIEENGVAMVKIIEEIEEVHVITDNEEVPNENGEVTGTSGQEVNRQLPMACKERQDIRRYYMRHYLIF